MANVMPWSGTPVYDCPWSLEPTCNTEDEAQSQWDEQLNDQLNEWTLPVHEVENSSEYHRHCCSTLNSLARGDVKAHDDAGQQSVTRMAKVLEQTANTVKGRITILKQLFNIQDEEETRSMGKFIERNARKITDFLIAEHAHVNTYCTKKSQGRRDRTNTRWSYKMKVFSLAATPSLAKVFKKLASKPQGLDISDVDLRKVCRVLQIATTARQRWKNVIEKRRNRVK
eukprot:TRINITY_DN12573_c2_g2_i11.p1 TRINITY_DN12573_c2_g2~~TRINITY_DN12573_c2_g2_i11.p1  ORF type:complete len:227 (+),score=23.37 TRINITY_DN12573_c2_g2_i11:82-762(+)